MARSTSSGRERHGAADERLVLEAQVERDAERQRHAEKHDPAEPGEQRSSCGRAVERARDVMESIVATVTRDDSTDNVVY